MSLVMDFLQGIAQPFEYLGKTDIINPAKELGAQFTGNKQAQQNANKQSNKDLGLGESGTDLAGGLKTFASEAAQIGIDITAPEIAGTASKAVPELGNAVASGLAKGAAGGAAIGGAQGTAQGIDTAKNPKDLTMDFLQGAGTGAALGGALGGAIPALKGAEPLNQIGAVGDIKPSNQFKPEDLQNMAKSQDPEAISKQLEPVTGKVVAQEISPAIAKTNDPSVAANIIDNSLNKKLTPDLTGTTTPSPAPTAIPPPTPTDNINTPAQVEGQASQEVANFNPQQPPQQNNLLPANTSSLGKPSLLAETSAASGQTAANREVELQNHVAQSSLPSTEQPATPPSPEEQSLFATAPPKEKPFMNAPGETGTSHVQQTAALREASQSLDVGHSITDVANQYIENTGASVDEAKSAIDNLIQNNGSRDIRKGNINSSLNPQWNKVNVPAVAEGDRAGALGRPNALVNEGIEKANAAQDAINSLSQNDLEVLRKIRNTTPDTVLSTSRADNPEAVRAAAQAKKDFYDWDQAVGSKLLQRDVPYRQNYYGGLQLAPETEEGIGQTNAAAQLPTRPGFGQSQNFTNYEEALAKGVKPQFENDSQDFYADSARRLNGIQQLALHSGLDEAYPGQVNVGQFPPGSKQLLVPGGSKITLPAELANPINERAMPTPTGGLKGYDTLNNNFKYLKLGGGGFHLFNELGNYAAQQLASGKAFTDPSGVGNVFKSVFSQSTFDNITSEFRQNGKLMAMDLMHLTRDAPQLSQDVAPKGLVGRIPVLKQMYEATFGRAIPMMKMTSMAQWMDDNGVDAQNLTSEDVQAGTKYALQINKTYGGLDRMIQGLTPAQFKVISRGFLATDWTEAQLNTLMDAFRSGGAEGKLARQVVFGKALLFGGLATAGGGLGGEFKGKNPTQVAEDIIAKTINPTFKIGNYNVGFPETQVSEFTKPVTGTATALMQGKNALNPTENFFKARLSAPLSEGLQLATNKDFYGNPIHGQDFYGRPISAGQTAESLAAGVTPIPLSQAGATATGKQNVGAAIANTVGFHATPENNIAYAPIAGQTYVAELAKTPGVSQAQIQSDSQFFDLLGRAGSGKAKNKAIQQAETALKAGDENKANQIVADYNQKLIKTLAPWVQQGGTQYFDTTMLQQLRSAELTGSKVSKQLSYTTKTNPTSIGAQIQALPNQPQLVNK